MKKIYFKKQGNVDLSWYDHFNIHIHNILISNYLLSKTAGMCCMSVLIALIDLTLQLLFMAGTLVISMAMQLDRRGLWNLLGPVLVALVIMVTSWVSLTFPLLQNIMYFVDTESD